MYDGNIIISGGLDILDKYYKECIIDLDFFKRDNYDNLVGNIGILSRNIDELKRMEIYYKVEFGDILDVYLSGENVLSIAPKHISKGNGIKHVCDILGVDLDEVATIGDSPNDVPMLDGFKYSFAMENGKDEVKEVSRNIVKSVKDAIKIIDKINGVE